MKKGIALQTVVMLILAIISLAIGIMLIMKAGLISNLQTIICTTLITWTSYVRGILVNLIWLFFWAMIGVMALLIVIYGSFCKAFPGNIYCLSIYAAFIAFLLYTILVVFSGLPLMHCPNPTIKIGDFEKDCGDSLTSPEVFMREVAERSVDCWGMFSKGKFDPLTGKTPPNPRTCFVINFNLERGVTIEEIVYYLKTHEYPSNKKCDPGDPDGCGITYWDKIKSTDGGMRLTITRTNDYIFYVSGALIGGGEKVDDTYYSGKYIQKGRLFIKYLDKMPYGENIRDADCWTGETPPWDSVYWCFDEDVTCEKTGDGCVLAADNDIGC